jgi:predicted nucleic acid-binding Zn ribbon protein
MGAIDCRECGTPVPPQAKACPHCGQTLPAPPMTETELRQIRGSALTVKIVAVLLVLYMLGVVGVFIYDHLL